MESLRDVKDVQRHFAHLSGMADVAGMMRLFAEGAVLESGETRLSGRSEIEQWLRNDVSVWSGASSLRFEIIDQPLINLSDDDTHAAGRWQTKRFLGDGEGRARIEAGLYENEYRLEADGWKISLVRYFPQSAGEYSTGWTNVDEAGLSLVPAHFTPEGAGTPVRLSRSITAFGSDDPRDLTARIDRLNAEDDVRNLQHALGYYIDRRMWTDVEELFDVAGVLSINGVAYEGRDGIRRALELMGSEGLTDGHLNDRVIFDLVVDIQPDGDTAVCRGIELGLLGDANRGEGAWEFSVVESRSGRHGGIWRLQHVALTKTLRAPYSDGWGRGGVAEGTATALPHPPKLTRRRGDARPTARTDDSGPVGVLSDLERRLARSRAYDAVENVSAAYGYYLDDFQWPQMAALFATHGHKQTPFAGYYVGRDRILEAATTRHGAPKPDTRRERLVVHWRPQNVITVSHDARSASLRTRLFQTRTAARVVPEWTGIHSGSYANDQAVVEDGVWRLWSITIDEYYFTSPSWKGGWAVVPRRPADAPNPPPSPLLESCPPDIPQSAIGDRARGFRGGPGRTLQWPEIAPMWFHYRNLVSGRMPEHYWPDCAPSEVAPETSMTRHGYQMPPAGPAVDGIACAEHDLPGIVDRLQEAQQ